MVQAVALVPSEGVSLADIDALLTGPLGCRRLAAGRIVRTFYDTFDGRFYRAGLVVEHELLDGRAWLRVRRLGETVALVQAALAQAPLVQVAGPVSGLADSRVRQILAPAAAGRALMALVRTEGEQLRYSTIDRLEKANVRVSVMAVEAQLIPGTGNPRYLLEPVVTFSPVRGHDASFAALVQAVELRLGPRPAADPLLRASGVVGLALGVDPSDRAVALLPQASAFSACVGLLARAAEVLEANSPGLVNQLDEEFLHDIRVTLRATRAVVRAARGVLDPSCGEQLAQELTALMDLTSPVRDLDVLRAAWAGDPALAPLLEVLAQDHEECLRALLDAVRGVAWVELLAHLRAPRPAPSGQELTASGWAATVLPVELRRLHRAARRADRAQEPAQGSAASGAEEDPLHRTRKQAKRLRYLLDAFDSLYPGQQLDGLRRALKTVQTVLGDYQDATVADDAIAQAGGRLRGAEPAVLIELGRRSEAARADAALAATRFGPAYEAIAARRHRFAKRLAQPRGMSQA